MGSVWTWLVCGITCGLTLAGCAHYQSGGSYRSNGGFKTPGDYAAPAAPQSSPNEFPSARVDPGFQPRQDFRLYWPVGLVKINRGYRPISDQAHQGVDFGGARNTPILAAHEGVVIYTGHHFNGYGNMVLLEYNGEWATLYGHLNKITVKEGQVVLPGDMIGKMGSTGHATGVHLHFELMKNRQPIDPLPYLVKPSRVTAGR